MRKVFLLFAIVCLSACNKVPSGKITVDDMVPLGDSSLFRGIKPHMYYDELVALVGEPNELIDVEYDDEKGRNPVYYFKEGKVMCNWSGSKRDAIGVINYVPYNNTHIYINELVKRPLQDYNISNETEKVYVYKEDSLYYIIDIDSLEVRKAHAIMLKR